MSEVTGTGVMSRAHSTSEFKFQGLGIGPGQPFGSGIKIQVQSPVQGHVQMHCRAWLCSSLRPTLSFGGLSQSSPPQPQLLSHEIEQLNLTSLSSLWRLGGVAFLGPSRVQWECGNREPVVPTKARGFEGDAAGPAELPHFGQSQPVIPEGDQESRHSGSCQPVVQTPQGLRPHTHTVGRGQEGRGGCAAPERGKTKGIEGA